jgi:hypothetical protein
LRERKTAELVEAGKTLDFVIAAVSRHAPAERRQRDMLHQLAEYIVRIPVPGGHPFRRIADSVPVIADSF